MPQTGIERILHGGANIYEVYHRVEKIFHE